MQKIFPFLGGSVATSCLNLLIVAEGFVAAQEREFHGLCLDFIDFLLKTAPFNQTQKNAGWLNIWSSFSPSSQSGAFNGASAPAGRTVFDATSQAGELGLDQTAFEAWVSAEEFKEQDVTRPLTDIFSAGESLSGSSGTIVVVLLPSQGGAGLEAELTPADDQYKWLAVSADGLWEQFLLRAIAKKVGLGDEFENEGVDFLEPADDATKWQISNHFNLIYSDAPPAALDTPSMPWFPLFSAIQRTDPPAVHPRTGDPATTDDSIDAFPATQTKPEFWEGGGGFRRKVYRSAKDCLLRRKVGDPALPIRERVVPLCPACRHTVDNLIG